MSDISAFLHMHLFLLPVQVDYHKQMCSSMLERRLLRQ